METTVNGTKMALHGDRRWLHCGEHSIMSRVVKSPRWTPETDVTLHVNHTLKKKKKPTLRLRRRRLQSERQHSRDKSEYL